MRKRLTLILTLALAVAVIGTALTYAGGRAFHKRRPASGAWSESPSDRYAVG